MCMLYARRGEMMRGGGYIDVLVEEGLWEGTVGNIGKGIGTF